ncbi:hypothetical protein T492DRAFT_944822 [Pavlovales sp. CCMP2436]|nr:hypothetical protein T492DRAFT_944822 [Pavlovales sp. CCMP2436]
MLTASRVTFRSAQLGRALSSKPAAKAPSKVAPMTPAKPKIPPPPKVARGDTQYVISRRAYEAGLSVLRKQYAGEEAVRVANRKVVKQANMQRESDRYADVRAMKLDRAVDTQQRVADARLAAGISLALHHKLSCVKALAVEQARCGHMAKRVSALAAESGAWATEATLDRMLSPELFTTVRSPVKDTPSFSRAPLPGAFDKVSGVSSDHAMLVQLAKERNVDLPIWLRHTLVEAVEGGAR